MEWELSKENVQPLRNGRKNLELLNEALKAKSHAPSMNNLIHHRRSLLEAIDRYTGPDPLREWLKCIQWTKEAFPSGGAQSGILPMIELCLRYFWHDPRYKNDERYLKLWIDYANRTERPADIYAFMDVNDIGQSFALYYEGHAEYLERVKNFKKANEVFELGLAREAQPLDELKRKYKSFLARSMTHVKKKEEEEEDHDEGVVRTFGTQRGAPRTGLRPLQKTSKQITHPLSNQKFSVFVDEEFAPGPRVKEHHEDHSWHNLGTQAERSKENIQQPSKWKQAKIPQKHTKPFAVEPPLPVYVDEEFSRPELTPQNTPRRAPTSALEARLSRVEDMTKDTQILKQNPLRNFPRGLNSLR